MPTTRELPTHRLAVPRAEGQRLRRVLYAVALNPAQKFGSLEEQILVLARAFRARAGLFLPLFLCSLGPEAVNHYELEGVKADCLDLEHFRLGTLWHLLKLVAQHGIEVVHWNFCHPLNNAYLWLLTLLTPGVLHYYTDHNSRTLPLPPPGRGLKTFIRRLLLKRYTKVFCVSGFVQDCLRRQQAWSNLYCVPHFINTDRFQPDPAVRAAVRQCLGVGDRFVALTVAHLIEPKGVDVLLRALAQLPPSAELWIGGDGPEASRLADLASHLGVRDRARFLGLQTHVEPYMQAADCFVCPSLWAEAAGLVNLEAQACGLPVVASRIGGIPEYVDDGRTGLLFPPGDHVRLAEELRRLQADPVLCGELGRNARAHAVTSFSAQARLNDYLDLYRSPS